ncbi:MAG TPA: hypothetical protein VJB59_12715 [Bdellovibrionota bacterium]|nr:hypothetical protein [Bdellovibrionota bacterium]
MSRRTSNRISTYCVKLCVAACAALFAVSSSAAPFELNPEIEALRKSLEQKVQENVKTFLGDEARVVTSVQVIESQVRPQVKPLTPGDGVDILYAPSSFVTEQIRPVEAPSKNVVIDSVDVEIQIGGDVDATALNNARELVLKTLKGLNPKVTVTKLTLPPKKAPTPTPAPMPSVEPDKLSKAPEVPEWKTLLPLLSAVAAAFILTLGILIFGQAVKASAQTVVQGLSSLFLTSKSKDSLGIEGSEENPIVLEHKNGLDGGAKKPKSETLLTDYSRNVQIIKEALAQNPLLFLRAVNDSDQELWGIKWLLPNLTGDEQETVKKFLGMARVRRMAEIPNDADFGEQTAWLQDFVERLVLNKIRERTLVERALGSEKTARIFLIKPEHLSTIGKQLNTPGTWRILSEFLPRENFDKLIKEMPQSELQNLIDAARAEITAVAQAADQIIATAGEVPEEQQTEERAQFYSQTLLDPILNSLASKNFGEDDEFLDRISEQAPELATMVRERFWTPRDLASVADEALGLVLRTLRNEQRAAFIFALPAPHSERVESLLPQGNVRTIVTDQLTRMRQRNDANEIRNALSTARNVIESLRKDHASGKFKLRTAPAPVVGAAPPEVSKAA